MGGLRGEGVRWGGGKMGRGEAGEGVRWIAAGVPREKGLTIGQ